MTPFLYLFKVLNNLNIETELLEACEWDESRLSYVKEELEKCMSKYLETKLPLDKTSLLEGLHKALVENISEKEADACIFILKESMSSLNKTNGDKYEN